MAHELPLAVARKVDAALRQLDRIPLNGNAPSFDMAQLSASLASRLNTPSFLIGLGNCCWCDAGEISQELGTNVVSVGIVAAPLDGTAVWLMNREDMAHLTSWLMNGKTRGGAISSEALQEGFYRYIAAEAIDALQDTEPLKNFSLKISEENAIVEKQGYCIDIELSYNKKSC